MIRVFSLIMSLLLIGILIMATIHHGFNPIDKSLMVESHYLLDKSLRS